MLIRSYVKCAIFGISMAEMYTGRIGMKGDVELRISDETAYFSGLEDTFLLVRKSDSGCSTLLLENEGTDLLLIVAYIAGGLLIVLLVVILLFAIISIRRKKTLPRKK